MTNVGPSTEQKSITLYLQAMLLTFQAASRKQQFAAVQCQERIPYPVPGPSLQ